MARDKTERLLNLLFALMSVSRQVRREEIRTWLADLYGADQSDEAFEKMFERDKDELRSMGIPIDTITNPHGEVTGYRIDRDRVLMPSVTLTTEQAAALRLAAHVWADATENALTRRLDLAIGALAPDTTLARPVGSLPAPEPAFEPLLRAAGERMNVTFAYRRPDQPLAEQRHVQPWGVVSHAGHWYLVGHDCDRNHYRVFRLSRIEGSVASTSEPGAFTVPDGVEPATLVRAHASTEQQSADVTLRVTDDAPSYWRTLGSGETFVVTTDAPMTLVERACADAPHVRVESPDWAREAWLSRLRSAALVHKDVS